MYISKGGRYNLQYKIDGSFCPVADPNRGSKRPEKSSPQKGNKKSPQAMPIKKLGRN